MAHAPTNALAPGKAFPFTPLVVTISVVEAVVVQFVAGWKLTNAPVVRSDGAEV
ncbi:MAG: hypothetical protein QM811_17115 [Pirellulales bacterium]